MKVFAEYKIKLNAAILSLEILFFTPVIISSFFFGGCAHTVEYQAVHDTDTTTHHDSISGPAFLRFIAVLNNASTSGNVQLRLNSPTNTDLFANAGIQMSNQFIPIWHDSAFVLYANYFYGANIAKTDSVAIPRLKPFTMTTVVLYRTNYITDPNRIFAIFANDSARKLIAPKDSCYIRLINALPDYPQPSPSVNAYIDNSNAPPLFKDPLTGQPSPVNFQEVKNYVLIPAGNHKIFVRSPTDATQSYNATQNFISGQFYTMRLTGMKADGTDVLSIDTE